MESIFDVLISIGDRAFANCHSLASVTIGKGVTSIRELAFWNCSNLTSIYALPQQAPVLENNRVFEGVPFSSCTFYLPKTNTGYNNEQWNQFTNRIENL